MSEQNENSSILSYATPSAGEPRPPFVAGRRLGLISALLGFSPIVAAFIVPRFDPPAHVTFYCCGGLLSLGILVGILGIVLDGRKSAGLLATTLNILLFLATIYFYPFSFADH